VSASRPAIARTTPLTRFVETLAAPCVPFLPVMLSPTPISRSRAVSHGAELIPSLFAHETEIRQLIGIGRSLTASPLPPHRTYGSRLRRFGRHCQGETSPPPERRLPACQPRIHPRGRASPDPSPEAIAPLHDRPRLLSTVQAFSTLLRACRVGGGGAGVPCLRPLVQTARAVFPQAAFLRCSTLESSMHPMMRGPALARYPQE
jgi:hypothetical protein